MSSELEEKLDTLENEGDELIKVGKEFLKDIGPTEFTYYIVAVLNRTINLNRGFITLVQENNFIAAAPLVRLNLDSLLRLFASVQSEHDVELFARKVRKGVAVRDMNYYKNPKNKLTDQKLVSLLKEIRGFNWVQEVYEAGSGYIHMSHQHIYSSIKVLEPDQVEGGIRKTDEFIPLQEKIAGTHYMCLGSKGIRTFLGDILQEIKNT